jgi:hypothetical protein
MTSPSLKGLLIRTGNVRRPDLGFLLAGDPIREDEEEPFVAIFKWKAGQLTRVDAHFNANTSCIIEDPEYGVLRASSSGAYSIETRSGVSSSNIFNNSQPTPSVKRFGDVRSVRAVTGKAYAIGGTGWAFRLDQLSGWTLIDAGLPTTVNLESIDGVGPNELYAAGYRGAVWRYDGRSWFNCDTPTNVNLNVVRCAADGFVYAAGRGGFLMRGKGNDWQAIDQSATSDDIWDLAFFEGHLYVSTLAGLFRIENDNLTAVEFGGDVPRSCYHLSVAPGVMWSIGARDVMAFDGSEWTRIARL